jgi:hypothetical protein
MRWVCITHAIPTFYTDPLGVRPDGRVSLVVVTDKLAKRDATNNRLGILPDVLDRERSVPATKKKSCFPKNNEWEAGFLMCHLRSLAEAKGGPPIASIASR